MKKKKIRFPDWYPDLLQRDFCLGAVEINGSEGNFKAKPWTKGRPRFKPYCLFERRNGLVYYFFSEAGIRWVKSQIGKRFTEKKEFFKDVIKNFEHEVKPFGKELFEGKKLPLKKLKDFSKKMKEAWPWFEAH